MVVPAELRQVADRARPVTLARERTLPVAEPLQPLLPDGALARGSSVAVVGAGATTLALNLAARASAAGSWTVVVGLPDLGLAAAAEAGMELGRLALVAAPDPGRWAATVAALVGGIDLVVVDGRAPLTSTEGRRLAARVRERGSVLLPVTPGSRPAPRRPGAWPIDVTLSVGSGRWEGLGEGHGHLRRRRVQVEVEGRGRAARLRRVEMWLPSALGPVAQAGPASSGAPTSTSVPTPSTPSTPSSSERREGVAAPERERVGGRATVVPFRPGRRAG